MRNLLDFDDPGASDDEPAKGVTMGDIRAWFDQMDRLRAALQPFASGGDWGTIKAWLVHGAPDRAQAIDVARGITEWQVAVDEALNGDYKK